MRSFLTWTIILQKFLHLVQKYIKETCLFAPEPGMIIIWEKFSPILAQSYFWGTFWTWQIILLPESLKDNLPERRGSGQDSFVHQEGHIAFGDQGLGCDLDSDVELQDFILHTLPKECAFDGISLRIVASIYNQELEAGESVGFF